MEIAETLRGIIGTDTSNESAKDPMVYINLKINKWWVTNMDLDDGGEGVVPQRTLVYYDKLPIRCKTCQSWKHRIKDIKETQRQPTKMIRRPPPAYHTYKKDKGKNAMVDEEGFQHVRNRRNSRMNIFNAVDDEQQNHAFEQREINRVGFSRTTYGFFKA